MNNLYYIWNNFIAIHLGSIIRSLVIIIATFILAKTINYFLNKNIKLVSKKISEKYKAASITRVKLLNRLIILGIYFIGLAAALYQFQSVKNIAAIMFASAGIFSLVLGLAARESFGNIIAGFIIIMTQPIRIGDFVTIDNFEGKIEEITLNHTVLKTSTNQRVIIPNESLTKTKIVNYSIVDPSHVAKINISFKYDFDLKKIREGIVKFAAKNDIDSKDLKINIEELGKDSFSLEINFKTKNYIESEKLRGELKENILNLIKKQAH